MSDTHLRLHKQFLGEARLPRESSPLVLWRDDGARFPLLCAVAARYLAAPATSVPSERLFSTADDVCGEKRTCLLTENIKRLEHDVTVIEQRTVVVLL